jgi:transcriptional regulator with XRE-family HTH domain
MSLMRMVVSDSEVLRAYITTLRSEQRVSQKAVADAISMPLRTYQAWENAETKDIKLPLAVRAIQHLGGLLDHLGELKDEEDAARLARDWVRLSPEQRQQVSRIKAKAQRVIELGERDPAKMEQVIERLRADAQADPVVLDMVLAWLDGRRSR